MIATITITVRIIATGRAMRSDLCDLSSLDEIFSTTEKRKVFALNVYDRQ